METKQIWLDRQRFVSIYRVKVVSSWNRYFVFDINHIFWMNLFECFTFTRCVCVCYNMFLDDMHSRFSTCIKTPAKWMLSTQNIHTATASTLSLFHLFSRFLYNLFIHKCACACFTIPEIVYISATLNTVVHVKCTRGIERPESRHAYRLNVKWFV